METRGMGINTMRYRARMIGGGLRVEPRTEGGTRVVCSFSVSDADTPEIPSQEAPRADVAPEDPARQPAVAEG